MKKTAKKRSRISKGGPNHGQKPALHRKKARLKTGVKK